MFDHGQTMVISLPNHGRPCLETVFNHGKTMADYGLFMLLSPGRDESMHQVVAYKKLELQKIIKSPALKKWSGGGRFTRGSNCKALTGKILVFWISGRLWEVVGHGSLTVVGHLREPQLLLTPP